MFVCYMADLIAAIVQRQLRLAMTARAVSILQTLPEDRSTSTPTWEQLQRPFANHCKYELCVDGRSVKTHWDELTETRRQVLSLLDLPTTAFTG